EQPKEESDNYEYIHLEGADLLKWNLENIDLNRAHLEGATLGGAHLEDAKLMGTIFNKALLAGAFFTKASLRHASLIEAICWGIHLEGADLYATWLQGANLNKAYLDDKTQFLHCQLDSKTYISSTNIDVAKIDDITKSMLKYSQRRNNWEQSIYRFNIGLYESEGFWRVLWEKFPRIDDRLSKVYAFLPHILMIRGFWWCSNYGYSTWRVICSFIFFALFFAILYFIAGGFDCDWNILEFSCDTGIVENLFRSENGVQLSWPMVFLRAVYFSVVTMTTLGFGDIYAVVNKPLGHVVLMLQVILGYALLGVLITRFAVLFNGDGPTYVPPESLKHKVERKSFLTKIVLIYVALPIIIVAIWKLLIILLKIISTYDGWPIK
ncbi:MAG: pentapeptide repeat-containing protein, partial [Planctomycetota bacterium]